MKIDGLAVVLVVVVACGWLLILIGGLVSAAPFGLIGVMVVLAVLAVLGWILFRVIVERLRNAEDDHYERTVDR